MRPFITGILVLLAVGLWAMGNAPCGDGKACPEKIEVPDTRLPQTCIERNLEPIREKAGMRRIPARHRCASHPAPVIRLPAFWLDTVATSLATPDSSAAQKFCQEQGKRLPTPTELHDYFATVPDFAPEAILARDSSLFSVQNFPENIWRACHRTARDTLACVTLQEHENLWKGNGSVRCAHDD